MLQSQLAVVKGEIGLERVGAETANDDTDLLVGPRSRACRLEARLPGCAPAAARQGRRHAPPAGPSSLSTLAAPSRVSIGEPRFGTNTMVSFLQGDAMRANV